MASGKKTAKKAAKPQKPASAAKKPVKKPGATGKKPAAALKKALPKKPAPKAAAKKAPARPAPKKAPPKPASKPARKAAPPVRKGAAAKPAAASKAVAAVKPPQPRKAAAPAKASAKAPAKAAAKAPAKVPAKPPAPPVKAAAKAPAPAPATAPVPPKSSAPVKAAKPAAPAPAPEPAPAAAPAPKPAPKPAPAPKAPAAPKAEKAPKVPKRKPIPSTSIAATPVIRPLSDLQAPQAAPPPPPAKPGHVDHQVLSAITYGLFSAINKTFGFAGQSVVKNASLRMLEYGYKRGWLPPKAKEPAKALNEFFGRLETMGYAEKLHVAKRGDGYALEILGLADFDSLHELRSMHYPLLPFFLGEMLQAILDQYFQLKVTLGTMEVNEARRGVTLPFTMLERPAAPTLDTSRIVPSYRLDDFEE